MFQSVLKIYTILINESLIKKISTESKIPVIKHLDGNCHVYIDSEADFKVAMKCTINSKTQRYGVCNAAESLIIHKDFSKSSIINSKLCLPFSTSS